MSVCVPTWNGAAHLAQCLDGVLAQTESDFELVLVDDGSTDATGEVLARYADPRLVVHRNPRRLGIPGNWNRCLALARAPYVQFAFQDDVLAPAAVERLRAALDADPHAVLAFGRREIRHEGARDGLPLVDPAYARALAAFHGSFRGRLTGAELVSDALARGADLTVNVVGEPSFVMLRTEALRRAGGFDAAFTQLVDWELWLRLAADGGMAFVDETLGMFRVHGAGASARNHRSLRMPWEFLRLLRRVARLYGPRLTPQSRKLLASARWRARRYACGETLRRLS